MPWGKRKKEAIPEPTPVTPTIDTTPKDEKQEAKPNEMDVLKAELGRYSVLAAFPSEILNLLYATLDELKNIREELKNIREEIKKLREE